MLLHDLATESSMRRVSQHGSVLASKSWQPRLGMKLHTICVCLLQWKVGKGGLVLKAFLGIMI